MHCLNKHKEKCSDETKSKHSMHCKTSNDSCCCDIVDSKWLLSKKNLLEIYAMIFVTFRFYKYYGYMDNS